MNDSHADGKRIQRRTFLAAVCGPHLANLAFHHKTRARLNKKATKAYV
jgi:hypothetical protein